MEAPETSFLGKVLDSIEEFNNSWWEVSYVYWIASQLEQDAYEI